MMQRRIDQGLL